MSKKKKKRRSFVPESEAKNAVKQSFAQFNWKLAGRVLLNFVIVFGIYQFLLKMCEHYGNQTLYSVVIIGYVAITTVLAAVFFIINRGASNDIPTKEQLNDSMTTEEKEKFIDELIKARKKAKKLLPWLIPFIFTLLFDMLYLLFFVK